MRILITNDDGIHAAGLVALEEIAKTISDDVWVVAPADEQSGAGHSLSLSDPLRYRHIGGRHYEVTGTPTDCVIMAVRKIMPALPDLILSGVNRGQNIADDVTYSGTIAAAMEGTALGMKEIAHSQCLGMYDNEENDDGARQHGASVVAKQRKLECGSGKMRQVNDPDGGPAEGRGTGGRNSATRSGISKAGSSSACVTRSDWSRSSTAWCRTGTRRRSSCGRSGCSDHCPSSPRTRGPRAKTWMPAFADMSGA